MSTPTVSTSCFSSTFAAHPCLLHPVGSTDTLAGIALKYGAQVAAVRRLNRLYADDAIFARPLLVIPLNPTVSCHCHAHERPTPTVGDHEHAQMDSAIEVDLSLVHSHRWASTPGGVFPSPPPTPEPSSLACSPARPPRRGPSCPPPTTRRDALLASMSASSLSLVLAPQRCPTCNAFPPSFLLSNCPSPSALQTTLQPQETSNTCVPPARFDERLTQIDDEIASALDDWNQVTAVECPFVPPLEDPNQPFRPLPPQDGPHRHRHHLMPAHAAVQWVLALLDVPNRAAVVPLGLGGKSSRVRAPSSVASSKGSQHEEDREYELHSMRRRHFARDSVTSVET